MTEANTPRTPDAEAVRAQAASWLLRRRDYDGWTDEDQRSLDVWLDDFLPIASPICVWRQYGVTRID